MAKRPANTLTKSKVEEMCRRAGLKPERRVNVRGTEVFVCDGFSAQPHITFKRFGVDPGEFSFGAYCTIWWIEGREGEFSVGMPMIFDAFHDGNYDTATKKIARVNSAIKDATRFIENRKKVNKHGV